MLLVDTNAVPYSRRFYKDIDDEVSSFVRKHRCVVCGREFCRMKYDVQEHSVYCRSCFRKRFHV